MANGDAKDRLGFHPATDVTRPKHQQIRAAFIALDELMDEIVPKGRELALVKTNLQQAAMWANAGVAINLAPQVDE